MLVCGPCGFKEDTPKRGSGPISTFSRRGFQNIDPKAAAVNMADAPNHDAAMVGELALDGGASAPVSSGTPVACRRRRHMFQHKILCKQCTPCPVG